MAFSILIYSEKKEEWIFYKICEMPDGNVAALIF